jgi:hypothetical protein
MAEALLDERDGTIGTGVVHQHRAKVLVRLLEQRIEAGFQMLLTVPIDNEHMYERGGHTGREYSNGARRIARLAEMRYAGTRTSTKDWR